MQVGRLVSGGKEHPGACSDSTLCWRDRATTGLRGETEKHNLRKNREGSSSSKLYTQTQTDRTNRGTGEG